MTAQHEGKYPLEGRAFVVTGGARGIGESCVRLLSELGARVIVADLDGEALKDASFGFRDCPSPIHTIEADVSDAVRAAEVVSACIEHFGRIDGIVNNAALHSREWFLESDPAWDRQVVEANVLGVIYGSRAAAKAMGARGGAIVNMTSGAQCGLVSQAVYGATKGAVASLTYALALELSERNIRVNAVSPLAATRMALFTPEFAFSAAAREQELPSPSNNAALVAYLLSDRSDPLTGQVVRVDNKGICMMSHPAIMEATLQPGTNWSFERVATVFDEGLKGAAVPLGVVPLS